MYHQVVLEGEPGFRTSSLHYVDYVDAFIEYQNEVLAIAIRSPSSSEPSSSYHPALLVLSGVSAGARYLLSEDERDFVIVKDILMQKKPQIWCLNTLKIISDTLKEKREYGDFSTDLDKIREMLKAEWGIKDPSQFKTKELDTETTAPPPVLTKDKSESTTECKKCGSTINSNDRFCKECGTITQSKPKRWSPS